MGEEAFSGDFKIPGNDFSRSITTQKLSYTLLETDQEERLGVSYGHRAGETPEVKGMVTNPTVVLTHQVRGNCLLPRFLIRSTHLSSRTH